MILVIDTSALTAVVATIEDDGRTTFHGTTGRGLDRDHLRRLVSKGNVTKVAVASGPGSFTGLRVGVAFGLGIAIGLRIPIVPLPSLALQAARSKEPVTAVADAGRGRFYYQVPGSEPALGSAADIPTTFPLVGRVAHREAALLAAGHRFKPTSELRSIGEAARKLLETAPEVPYRNLEIEYMQSFSPRKV